MAEWNYFCCFVWTKMHIIIDSVLTEFEYTYFEFNIQKWNEIKMYTIANEWNTWRGNWQFWSFNSDKLGSIDKTLNERVKGIRTNILGEFLIVSSSLVSEYSVGVEHIITTKKANNKGILINFYLNLNEFSLSRLCPSSKQFFILLSLLSQYH